MKKAKMGYKEIRKAMLARERWAFSQIRQGDLLQMTYSLPIMKAVDRLEAKGRIKWSRRWKRYSIRIGQKWVSIKPVSRFERFYYHTRPEFRIPGV